MSVKPVPSMDEIHMKYYTLAPEQWENAEGPEGWWAVAHDDLGIVAYTFSEQTALDLCRMLDVLSVKNQPKIRYLLDRTN